MFANLLAFINFIQFSFPQLTNESIIKLLILIVITFGW